MRYDDGERMRRCRFVQQSFFKPMTNKEITIHLVNLLQTHRDSTSDDDWDLLDGSPLGITLDAIADLEYEVEKNGYQGENRTE